MNNKTPFFLSWRCFLAPMRSGLKATVRSLDRATLTNIEERLSPALPSDLLEKPKVKEHSRHRVFFLNRTFWCWVWQIFQCNTSCREVVDQVQALLEVLEEPPIDSNSSAYCQARANLPLPLLNKAFLASTLSAQKKAPKGTLLQGRPIKFGDGTTVRMEDTPANRKQYPPQKNQFNRPSFPLMKTLVFFDLASGAIMAKATGTKKDSELGLLVQLKEHLKPGDILGGDRAYGVFVALHWVKLQEADLVARLSTRSRKVSFKEAIKMLGPQDGLFLWRKPSKPSPLLSDEQWKQVPETMVVRILHLRVNRPGFRTRQLTVVTTLLDAQLYPAEEIFEVYFRRWRLEMCLDDLKTTMGMEKLNCRSPAMVEKELLMFLIAHNLIRWIMCQAAQLGEVNLERISFKGTMDAFRQFTQAIEQVRGPGKLAKQKRIWRNLLRTLAEDLVPERPGRHEPRAVKKKSKYPRLTKPRHRYAERWSRNRRRRAQHAKNRARLN